MTALHRLKILGLYCLLLQPLGSHAAAAQGYVIQWGWNTTRAKPLPVAVVTSNAVAVSAGEFQGIALQANGSVVAFGNLPGDPPREKGAKDHKTTHLIKTGGQIITNVASIAAGRDF